MLVNLLLIGGAGWVWAREKGHYFCKTKQHC